MFRHRSRSFAAACALPLLCSLTLISTSADARKPLPAEELEHYDDAPVYVWRSGLSPRMISQHDAFTSTQVNVSATGQNITGDAANEPSITVDPTNGAKMTIGWRQFNSVASNFRQAGWGYTGNSGASWTFPGVLENNVFRSDPVLASDSTGGFFYLSLLETFFDDMWRSLNGGVSFTRLAPATGVTSSGSRSIGQRAPATASNTRAGAPAGITMAAGSLAARPMAALPGSTR